jgi:Pyruvate/2-oxoacid:ferredoxin oxidoreductase gamma subunit
VEALDRALVATGWPAASIVIVTDIGCTGLSDRHFLTNAFHGLHGRSITYGTGIRLANPDLHVVVLMGDGGCGIGGAHLINAARRNIGLTVLVSNNFNFGMTGGQHSVTTPEGAVTSTTTGGNVERPMDLCGLVEAAGGTFVARASTADADLDALLTRALDHKGFAFLDVWNFCTAYFASRNRFTPKAMRALSRDSGMRMGILKDASAPELARALQAQGGRAVARVTQDIPRRFEPALTDPLSVVVAGSAGQRVRSAASLLGHAAIASGLYATQKDDYPITVRTGHSTSEVILSPAEILYTAIESPDVVVLLSEDGLGQVAGRLQTLPPDSLILADEALSVAAPPRVNVETYPFRAEAKKHGKASVTVLALGTFLTRQPVIPFAALRAAAESHPDEAIGRANRGAAEAGAALAANHD